jgi:argininosuccinate lyase
MSKILRGGRLSSSKDDVIEFTSSIKDDIRLSDSVIDINKAHVIMLVEKQIIAETDGAKLLQALSKLDLSLNHSSEDVHMAVEEAVLKETGPEVGGNLHIAKSRNDQVATAIRMTLRNSLHDLKTSIAKLQENLVIKAKQHVKTVILSYTHLQPAQPVTFAHYLLSRFDAADRDLKRLQCAYDRINLCPMGAGALATTSFPIDRERVAKLLGFSGLVENSIDAVGSRDFILETIAILSILAVNLSQFAEDLIIWSSPGFGVIELPDEFTSTSSMMPQKKNPEVPEIIRARTGHVLGDFLAAASIMKGMASTYNLDLQEVTPRLWSALDTVQKSVDMMTKLIPDLKITSDVSEKASASFVAATELANILVRRYNIPFRSAHTIVGSLVKSLLTERCTLENATPELLRKVAKLSTGIELTVKPEDLSVLSDPMELIESHRIIGGPSPSEVHKALKRREECLAKTKLDMRKLQQELKKAQGNLTAVTKSLSTLKTTGKHKT